MNYPFPAGYVPKPIINSIDDYWEQTHTPSPNATPEPTNDKTAHSHYFKDVSRLKTIDVYRVLELFNVSNPSLQHAIKKLLVAGGRGNKDIEQDVKEAIDSLVRWQNMRKEDNV